MNECEVCRRSYVVYHFADAGLCNSCLVTEDPWRKRISAQVQAVGGDSFIVEFVRRGPRRTPGGMSDLTIPEFDPPPAA